MLQKFIYIWGKILNLIKSFFITDKSYKEDVLNYVKVDAYIALIFYVFFMIMYYFMGRVYAERQIYLGVWINIILTVICLIIIKVRKQKLSSVGFTMYKMKKSLILGSVLGVMLLITSSILPNLLAGNRMIGVKEFLYNIFYYFIIIGLVEELIFRGYIQTRMYGLINKRTPAILITAVLFMLMHIPFQMGNSNMGLFEFIANNAIWLLITAVWHVVFDFLYRKYNNILAGTIFHGFMNFGNSLFR